ncbi:MAG: cell division topological specificity factor MinE [Rudaea sp.]
MDWLSRLFGRNVSSAQIAKNRLKLVLSYDRTNITPEMLSMLQDEIVKAISRHLEIDRDGMTFETQRGDNGDHLVADIPIRSVHSPVAPEEPPTPAAPPVVRKPPPPPTYRKKHKKKY